MYTALAPLAGAIITLMNAVNSRFALTVGDLPSIVVIHLVGLIAVSLVLVFVREEGRGERLPLFAYSGGLLGIATIGACNYAYPRLGASLAVALALLGQTLFSLVLDRTGILGRQRRPLSPRILPGLALTLLGILLMAGRLKPEPLSLGLALLSGALPVLCFALNSELGRAIGIFRSARINYAVGLATSALLLLALSGAAAVNGQQPGSETMSSLGARLGSLACGLASAGPLLLLGGGLLGLAVVGLTNWIFPRLSALSAGLLLFSGQALAGLLLDAVAGGGPEPSKLLGTLAVLAGLVLNALLAEGGSRAPRPPQRP